MTKKWPRSWKVLTTIGAFIVGVAAIVSAYYAVIAYHKPPQPPSEKATQSAANNQSTTLTDKNPEKRNGDDPVQHKKPPANSIAKVFKPLTSHPPQNQKIESLPPIQATKSNIFSGTNYGNVNQTIKDEFPEPKFDFKQVKANSPENGAFISEFFMTIESKTTLKNLYLEARSPSITMFGVTPQRTGGYMAGHSHTGEFPGQKLNGVAFTNLPNAYGTYRLVVTTTKPDKVEVTYDYE